MRFSRITEQNAYHDARAQNERFRAGKVEPRAIYGLFADRGVDVARSVFVGMHLVDDGEFAGTIVTQQRRVFEFVFSTDEATELEWNEIDPSRSRRDSRSPLSMALVLFDEENE